MIIERRIAARRRLQPVVEIQHDFIQRHLIEQQHAAAADVLELLLRAALFFQQLQDLAEIFLARDHRGIDDRLFDLLDLGRIGKLLRIVDFDTSPSVAVT